MSAHFQPWLIALEKLSNFYLKYLKRGRHGIGISADGQSRELNPVVFNPSPYPITEENIEKEFLFFWNMFYQYFKALLR